jgi:L-lactate permease
MLDGGCPAGVPVERLGPATPTSLALRLWCAPLSLANPPSGALFANLQKTTASQKGLSPVLAVGTNSSGGVLGKMISPQNLAVGTSATGLSGQEGRLFRPAFR